MQISSISQLIFHVNQGWKRWKLFSELQQSSQIRNRYTQKTSCSYSWFMNNSIKSRLKLLKIDYCYLPVNFSMLSQAVNGRFHSYSSSNASMIEIDRSTSPGKITEQSTSVIQKVLVPLFISLKLNLFQDLLADEPSTSRRIQLLYGY